MEKVKVLYFVDRMLRGGIQSLVIDWVTRFDKNKIQVDFLLLDDGNEYELEDYLKELGCNIYKLEGVWINKPFDYIKYHKKADDFFKLHNDYKVVHLHSSSKNYPILKYAKKYNIPIRIAHSHNIDFQATSKFKKMVGNYFKILLKKYATDFFACSNLAGEWLFGSGIMTSSKYRVISNAIDYSKFKYDSEVRKKIRKELKVNDDTIVIGNVGRFAIQKNHKFLVEIFCEYHKQNSNSILVLIGTGELEKEIKNQVNNLNLTKSVCFTGFKNNVNEYIQGLDIFLLPSLYEGLPVVGIEAQAAGLPCYMSKDVITEEVKIADNVHFISLNKTPKEWADTIISNDNSRVNNYKKIKDRGYIISDVIKTLEDVYQGKSNEKN